MGLLRSILALPIKAPVSGPLWIARQIAEAAEKERNDPARLRAALREAEAALLAGDLSEEAYDAIEDDLLARLRGAGR